MTKVLTLEGQKSGAETKVGTHEAGSSQVGWRGNGGIFFTVHGRRNPNLTTAGQNKATENTGQYTGVWFSSSLFIIIKTKESDMNGVANAFQRKLFILSNMPSVHKTC